MAFKKIGALWLKDGKKGKFMSGQVEINGVKTNIIVFKNNKKLDKHPDYQINVIVDEEQKQDHYTEQGGNRQETPPPMDDDIPF